MSRYVFLVFIITFVGIFRPFTPKEDQSSHPNQDQELLSQWFGIWQGEVEARSSTGNVSSFQMKLEIRPLPNLALQDHQAEGTASEKLPRFIWKTIYTGAQGASVRDYELVLTDPETLQFEIDEKNGIRIPATLLGNSFVSQFTVADVNLWVSHRLSHDASEMEFEIVTASNKNSLKTMGAEVEVVGLKTSSRQTATLKKVRD